MIRFEKKAEAPAAGKKPEDASTSKAPELALEKPASSKGTTSRDTRKAD